MTKQDTAEESLDETIEISVNPTTGETHVSIDDPSVLEVVSLVLVIMFVVAALMLWANRKNSMTNDQ